MSATKQWFNLTWQLRTSRGFTLIEMSIVLVIIGLIIGGILKGQELIRSAREKSVIDDVSKIQAAVLTFSDRFQTWPGDYSRASTRIKALLPDGDGNGTIDDVRTTNDSVRAPRVDWRHGSNMTNNQRQEYQSAWLHLHASEILPIVNADPSAVTDETFPEGPHPAMHFELGHSTGNLRQASNQLPYGLYIRYARWNQASNPQQNGGLRPDEAQRIDRKLDDGLPYEDTNANEGYRATVFATNGQDYANQSCGTNQEVYAAITNVEPACTMLFKVAD